MHDRFLIKKAFLLIVLPLLIAVFGGCEGDTNEDTSGADKYFEENSVASEDRPDPESAELLISPEYASISIVGQTLVFNAKGGEGPYSWTVSNPGKGHVNVQGWSEAVYVCDEVGNNDVIVQDQEGHTAVAKITPVADDMSITPESVDLDVTDLYVAFSVSGGTPPYSWSVGNPSLGTISYSSATSHTAGYTVVSDAYGVNVITVSDSEGRTISATVTRTSGD